MESTYKKKKKPFLPYKKLILLKFIIKQLSVVVALKLYLYLAIHMYDPIPSFHFLL